MVTIEQQPPADIEVTLSHILRYPDIQQLERALHTHLREGSIANLLLAAAREFRGWQGGGPWWSDLTLTKRSNCPLAFTRIALVGAPRWRIWLQTFVGSLACDEIKFFPHKDHSKARDWLSIRRDVAKLISHDPLYVKVGEDDGSQSVSSIRDESASKKCKKKIDGIICDLTMGLV